MVDRGKDPILGAGVALDGFSPVRDCNRNRGQKRTFKERQDEDTFNRFEVLDDLS